MMEKRYRSREYFLALIAEYFTFVRNDLKGQELPGSADIAYALHNLPSMLVSADWSEERSEMIWSRIWWAAGFRKCRTWFEEVDGRLLALEEQGKPLIHEFAFD